MLFCIPWLDANAEKFKDLIVYGNGFVFHVREPGGWTGDTDFARENSTNIAFTKGPKFDCSKETLISVKILDTEDHKIELDLAADKSSFLKIHPNSKAQPFKITNLQKGWHCVGTDYVGKTAHEYVSYCSPGSGPFIFSIAMNKQSTTKASDQEVAAYTTIVNSLKLISERAIEQSK